MFIPKRTPPRPGRRSQLLARRYMMGTQLSIEHAKEIKEIARKLDTTQSDILHQCVVYALDNRLKT